MISQLLQQNNKEIYELVVGHPQLKQKLQHIDVLWKQIQIINELLKVVKVRKEKGEGN